MGKRRRLEVAACEDAGRTHCDERQLRKAKRKQLRKQLRQQMSDVLTCAVCCGPLQQCVAFVPCGHLYCEQCISAWTRGTCPTCRTNATAPPMRLRSVDELVQCLGAASSAGEAKDGGSAPCSVCSEQIVEPPTCELCEATVAMCASCAEAYMGRCDSCERWFCDSCAGRECRWCRLRGYSSHHVCRSCRRLALSQCPSPLQGGML